MTPGLPVRRAAVAVLGKVVHNNRMLASELDAVNGHPLYRALADNDRALLRAILGVALRRRGQISDLVEKLLDRPIPEKTGRVEDILHVAIAQILFLDVADHAAVSVAVDEAGGDRMARPYKGLVNAVLRRLIRERDTLLADQDPVALNAPGWLFQRWRDTYGAETARAITAAHMEEPGLDLTLKPAENAAAWAARLGAQVLPTGSLRLVEAGRVEELDGFSEGTWWVQDAAAALPVRLLGDVAGLNVADLCAAPGGKTAQLAAAGAKVTAVDISNNRLKRVSENMARLSLDVEILAADLGKWEPAAPFDAILLDAPCTATGTARRHPDMPWLKRESDIATLAEIQGRFLRRALSWLKPGGVLVYCTCSLEPEEGERQIEALLAEGAGVERVPIASGEIAGLDGLVTASGDLRTLPCHWPSDQPRMGGLDGFFASRLKRVG
ncbi:RsmB/NOP family class I SAM-dependent RNA methyltransferase [Breoghania corrubedonensis]|uniref:RsmB/NOP family class I SAM-dependent RNA methyltransferase n=1 Tax=Breoghania corrubedonensis TaxID=665038 RepID=UPI000D372602|nr:transcription antitermination factor NusB [Breoghania corrubedonensis]